MHPALIRAELVAAIGKPCRYCGEPMVAPTRDHIRPRSKGGTLEASNKALACFRCNQDKGSRSLASWLYRLRMANDPRGEIVAQFVESRALECTTNSRRADSNAVRAE
jgi:5-methylcytosine-specific restriction endonuclease McrA